MAGRCISVYRCTILCVCSCKHGAVWMGIGLDIFDRLSVYVYGLQLFLLIACYMC